MKEAPVIAAGFPEMWPQVYTKYKYFFDCAAKLEPIICDMISTPLEGQLAIITGHIAAAAANSHGALLTLVLNGYGHDAVKIARSIYEADLNILWLKNHPADVEDFVDYNIIQQKQYYDAMDDEQKKAVLPERLDELDQEYARVLPRFTSNRNKTRPRNDWCKVSIYDRAKEAEAYWQKQMEADGVKANEISLYKAFYGPASSMHHLDIGGVIAHMDSDLHAHMAPSWEFLDDALVGATGSILRLVSYFDEIAKLGLDERLKAPMVDYVAACKDLSHK